MITSDVPKIVFIVPYRDRLHQKEFFLRQMEHVMEDVPKEDYHIYFAHQCDMREFNRGAMKNCGFLAIKRLYPNDYKNITFVFNDVDTMPITKNMFDYQTTTGTVKHFYGFTFALGGIVSITGGDFEKIGGFPNFWGWGYEDNVLQFRASDFNLKIDRSQFVKILDRSIVHIQDGSLRAVHRTEYTGDFLRDRNNGLNTIFHINFEINDLNMIDVNTFFTGKEPNPKDYAIRDLSVPIVRNNTMGFTWTRRGKR